MNIKFLSKNAKEAAKWLPSNQRAKELEALAEILASIIRVTRGRGGKLLQTTKNIFGVSVEKVDNYPYVLTEEEETPDQPYIKLAVDPNHACVIWGLQSNANYKWLIDYKKELERLSGEKACENLERAIAATDPSFPYSGYTPPPLLMSKGGFMADVVAANQRAIHTTKCVWAEGQAIPEWFSVELNEKLTPKPKPKAKKEEAPKPEETTNNKEEPKE